MDEKCLGIKIKRMCTHGCSTADLQRCIIGRRSAHAAIDTGIGRGAGTPLTQGHTSIAAHFGLIT